MADFLGALYYANNEKLNVDVKNGFHNLLSDYFVDNQNNWDLADGFRIQDGSLKIRDVLRSSKTYKLLGDLKVPENERFLLEAELKRTNSIGLNTYIGIFNNETARYPEEFQNRYSLGISYRAELGRAIFSYAAGTYSPGYAVDVPGIATENQPETGKTYILQIERTETDTFFRVLNSERVLIKEVKWSLIPGAIYGIYSVANSQGQAVGTSGDPDTIERVTLSVPESVIKKDAKEEKKYAKEPFYGNTTVRKDFEKVMTGFVITNDSYTDPLSFWIGDYKFTLQPGEGFEENFDPFRTVIVEATDDFRAYGTSNEPGGEWRKIYFLKDNAQRFQALSAGYKGSSFVARKTFTAKGFGVAASSGSVVEDWQLWTVEGNRLIAQLATGTFQDGIDHRGMRTAVFSEPITFNKDEKYVIINRYTTGGPYFCWLRDIKYDEFAWNEYIYAGEGLRYNTTADPAADLTLINSGYDRLIYDVRLDLP